MGEILEARRVSASLRLTSLRDRLDRATEIARNKACVYLTGSFGRGEASAFSDLDLFIVSGGDSEQPPLSKLDEILLKAELIRATRELGFPEFSDDGEYFSHYPQWVLINRLGKQDDDVRNTFTARLLLLLESRPLLGEDVYSTVIPNVINAYWRDYETRETEFIPAFLANDILRLWRSFCVNYEARTRREPDEQRAKRKLKNYKLGHSRLLTCYSALLYLLATFRLQKTVHPENAIEMTRLTPTERIEWILHQPDLADAHDVVRKLIEHYEHFLSATDRPKHELVSRILAGEELFSSQYAFGDLVFQAIEKIGQRSKFHRVLVV